MNSAPVCTSQDPNWEQQEHLKLQPCSVSPTRIIGGVPLGAKMSHTFAQEATLAVLGPRHGRFVAGFSMKGQCAHCKRSFRMSGSLGVLAPWGFLAILATSSTRQQERWPW